ncbi:MAG: TerC family protein [Salaquimonas sp.]|jgi:tellurite resistance protein TerC|nr:TerC family protein [Salaquimonas sp.]
MHFIFADAMGTPVWHWAAFLALVLGLMAFDLGILYRKAHVIGIRESLQLSAFYVTLALLFALFINAKSGSEAAFRYLTGYVVEQSLSMDNIFVMAVILSYFAIPRAYQHRVLFYGILGVILLRGVMILSGAALIDRFHWILYLFAAFLILTGIKMLVSADSEYDVAGNPVLKFMSRHFRVTSSLRGDRFIVREADAHTGRLRLFITPLLLALCVVEIADLIFAVDSIPAIFAITTDPFIVFTSNIFAILGLRSLFFALSALLHRFCYLKYALSLVLVFIGAKIVLAPLFGFDKMPPALSLGITLALLGAGVVASLWKTSDAASNEIESGEMGEIAPSPIADLSSASVGIQMEGSETRSSKA